MSTVHRGTANVLVGLTAPHVAARLRVLANRTDVLALQEWPRSRDYLTRDLVPWTFRRPLVGGGPIGVRRELGETVVSCRAVLLAGPGYVGRSPGRKSRAILGPSIATRLKSRRPDGTVVVRYNIHLTAGVQASRYGYRTDKAASRRVARHRRERDRIEWLVDRDHARGRVVEVYGDTNFHHMHIPGLVGWWRSPDLAANPGAPTFGGRAIDGIWTTERPDTVAFLPPLVPGEHRHVITTTHTKEQHP